MGHYELMSEMALGRRQGRGASGRVINRYREEEGERREEGRISTITGMLQTSDNTGGGWEGTPNKKENRKEKMKQREREFSVIITDMDDMGKKSWHIGY